LAENEVRNIRGIRDVLNLIALKPFARPVEVKRKIEAALKRQAALEASRITVSAVGSVVTLSGRVSTWQERELAAQAAWSAPGVTAVTDDLRVEP